MIDADARPEGWRFELLDEGDVCPVTFDDRGARYGRDHRFEACAVMPLLGRPGLTGARRGVGPTKSSALCSLAGLAAGIGYRFALLAPDEPTRAELLAAARAPEVRALQSRLNATGGERR